VRRTHKPGLRASPTRRRRTAQKPYEGCSVSPVGSLMGPRSDQPVADRDPRVPAVLQLALLHSAKHARGVPGGSPGKAIGGTPWKGRIPREHPAGYGLNTRHPARDSCGGQSPEDADRRSGWRVRLPEYTPVQRHAGPVDAENASPLRQRGTLRREESHERCRDEISPARRRRE
jgi:hypothetical protein